MNKFFRWFSMLNKRLYKKLSFVSILLLIPVLILTFSYVSRQESGFLHIVLSQADKTDVISNSVIKELKNEDSIILFTVVDNPQQAFDMVKSGDADQAWIFSDNIQEKIDGFSGNEHKVNSTVTVVCTEQSSLLNITNEKLSGTMYKHYAKSYYLNFVRENLSQLASLSDEELITYFDKVSLTEDLFVFASPGDSDKSISEPDTNYLFSPIRGLLSILIVLCGMAAAMYSMQDEKLGTFSWSKEQNRLYISFFCILIAVINISLFVFLSLLLTAQTGDIFIEIVAALMYTLCVSSFCLLLKQIFTHIHLYSSIMVLTIIVMIAVCPVFFDFRSIMWIQLLLPPTYYINIMYDNMYLLYMAIYSCIAFALCMLIQKYRTAKR